MIFDILGFCMFIAVLNLIGIGPSSDDPKKMTKEAGPILTFFIYAYSLVCLIGCLFFAWIIIDFFFFYDAPTNL